jgi:RNA 2',3'-cyclic 3'-phosphodiesterase
MKQNPPAEHTLRAFIAIELPEKVRSALHLVQEQLKEYRFKVTWTRLENIHLTLKFLGDIKREKVEPVVRIIEQAAHDSSPMTLCSQAVGFFPGVKHPRVLWTGISGQTDTLADFQGKIDKGLFDLGFQKDKKSFTGHLTLGRIKGGGSPELFIDIMKKFRNITTDTFIVDFVNLYQSRLMPSGPIYTKLFSVALGPV